MTDSEFRVYPWIEKSLRNLGWNTRNPSRGGQVYTQGEFVKSDRFLKQSLEGRPEFIVLVPDGNDAQYWIIEAKASTKQIEQASREAMDYADQINNKKTTKRACFATGVAGTSDDAILVNTKYWNGNKWKTVEINGFESSGFLSDDQCQEIIRNNNSKIELFEMDLENLIQKAHQINESFHANEIPVKERAQTISALLLAIIQDGNLRIHSEPRKLMREINGNIQDLLQKHGKGEYAEAVKLSLPATDKNHKKYRQALVEVLQHLRDMNIRSAINSGDDILGQFYETFLKYANGAKEMGIVLTPRHITKFAVDVLSINSHDRVFDPTCGTGGFLVSAMDHVRKNLPPPPPSQEDYDNFKQTGLYGVEQRDDVYGLALVNMLFRGDGKSNILDGNCFDHEFWFQNGKVFHTLPTQEKPKPADRPFTKVLMNPPFSLKSASEDKFVDYALRQTSPGSKLFAVIPTRLISGGDKAAKWRKNLLERHTLKAVIRFDKNLFYPVNVSTYGMILETHRPHEDDDKVFMGVLFDDEHRPRRSKLLSVNNLGDNVDEMTKELRRFLLGKPLCKEIVPREQGVFTLNLANNFDLSPQSYLPNGEVRNFNATTRILGLLSAQRMVQTKNTKLKTRIDDGVNLKHFPLSIFFETELQAPLKTLKDCEEGAVPVVSATATNNGITAWKDIHSDYILENCITISKTHNTSPCQAFWHPYKFTAISTVIVVEPVEKLLKNPMAILFLCQAITQGNSWKYDYSRPVQLSELEVFVPCKTKGEKKHKREVPDIEKMADLMIIQMSEIENKQFEGIDHDIDDLNEILAT